MYVKLLLLKIAIYSLKTLRRFSCYMTYLILNLNIKYIIFLSSFPTINCERSQAIGNKCYTLAVLFYSSIVLF